MKLASFDIFDTTLIRKCGRPENVFYILSKQLYPDDDASQTDFLMWRVNAERIARKALGKRDLSLEDIYSGFVDSGFPKYTKDEVIKRELALESMQLVSNLAVKRLIEEKRKKGYHVCFISDMYLSSDFLKGILINEGCAQEYDDVYVSCEYGKTKASSDLYDEVKKHFHDIQEWEHYGDNIQSDINQSKRKGAKAILVNTDFTNNEKLILGQYQNYAFSYDLSILIGFQRCAKLHLTCDDPDYENAADYIASAYISYLFYIFDVANKNGIKRLYFLYRDSHVLFKLSEFFCQIYPDIECRPLYASRKALFLPCMKDITVEYICHVIGGKKTLIGRMVHEILGLFNLDTDTINLPFSKIESLDQQQILVDLLLVHKNEIYQKIQRRKSLLDSYLEQEGIYDDVSKAIVDVGWYGSTRMMLTSLLHEKGSAPIPFIYYSCRDDVLGKNYGPFYTYLPYQFLDGQKTILIESYYSACDIPSTIGYSNNGNRIVPMFKKQSTINGALKKVTDVNVKTCSEVMSYIMDTCMQNKLKRVMVLWGVAFTEAFFLYPNHLKYQTLLQIDSYNDENKIIERLSMKDFFRYLLFGKIGKLCLANNSFFYSFHFDAKSFRKKMRRLLEKFAI